ncbi:NlpC/P60 family protein [Corynebacterium mayonis]|uniref:C40 family peptidase n=1 Tax=Corynebacterium mayonis TaxID=3062461 RepID=UPI003140AF7C
MGKHSLATRGTVTRRTISAAMSSAIAMTSVAVAVGGSAAQADEIDDMIQEMDSLSHEATGKNEEIKQTEDEIAAAEQYLEDLRARVVHARAEAQRAQEASALEQEGVDKLAASQNRNSRSDVILTSLGAQNPQSLIDRAAYLSAMNRKASQAVAELQEANNEAAARANEANIAVAQAQFQRNRLDSKRAKLERERSDLDERISDLVQRVDGMTPEQRSRWIAKGNPIAFPQALLSGAGAGVVGAAMAQLGKPYGWGAAGPHAFDCSGLMVWAYGQNGKAIPRTSQAQLAGGTPVAISELQPGDIVGYYPGVTHVGMYIGNGQVVHASDYGIPVQVVSVNSMPIQGAVRY